ncbi:hypothetical protein HDU67_006607 [Dinochytrium kinnereticum]|nr:hypothetical protein HDU67_006607 [Dinochytrium kinnereticum]
MMRPRTYPACTNRTFGLTKPIPLTPRKLTPDLLSSTSRSIALVAYGCYVWRYCWHGGALSKPKHLSFSSHSHSSLISKVENGCHDPEKFSGKENRPFHDDEEALVRIRLGRALRTLQDDIPAFFDTGLTDTTIYDPDLIFRDPCHEQFSHIVIKGRTTYLGLSTLLRWLLRIYYASIDVGIIRLVQFRGPFGGGTDTGSGNSLNTSPSSSVLHYTIQNTSAFAPHNFKQMAFTPFDSKVLRSTSAQAVENSRLGSVEPEIEDHAMRLMVRWVFEAVPRHQVLLSYIDPLYIKPSVFEGIFVYTFNEKGFITEHVLQSVYPCPPLLAMCRWWFRGSPPSPGGAELPTLNS